MVYGNSKQHWQQAVITVFSREYFVYDKMFAIFHFYWPNKEEFLSFKASEKNVS